MRHFAHNIGDYAAATAHLSFIEDAAYHRCLRRYYQDERALPADVAAVARLVGARNKEERQAVANVLGEFFTVQDDGYHQSRADREIEAYQAKAQAARENGTKGGRPLNREKTKTVAAQVRSEKLTTPHSPQDSSEPNGSGADAPEVDSKKLAFDAGVLILTKHGLKEPNARALIGKWRKDNGDDAVLAAIGSCQRSNVSEPVSWITATFKAERAEDKYAKRDREVAEAIERSKH